MLGKEQSILSEATPTLLLRKIMFAQQNPWSLAASLLLSCCQVASVVSDSVRPHRRLPTGLPHPWDSPGKNTGVGCHFLLQCMKVKSESEVTQSCPTLSYPMDCSPPGSSIHGIFQARVLDWVALHSPSSQPVVPKSGCTLNSSGELLELCRTLSDLTPCRVF